MSGTSFATPFVTGALALIWSIFPTASAAQLVRSIQNQVLQIDLRRSIIPSLLNVEAAYHILQNTTNRHR